MSYTFPTTVIQTYLTFTAKRWGQFPAISFTNGATAGSEVVTVASDLSSITVQIQSGVTTMAQVKTAIDATAGSANGLSAGDLVSVAITNGHTTDAVVTVNQAFLLGGVAVAKAKLTIGHLVFTAATAGAAGNNIRIKYTSGSSLTVTVATNDITIQLKNDGSSTNSAIKTLVDGDSDAHALVAVASDGLAMSFVPTVAMASAFANLTGGADAAAAVKILQDLTFTAGATGTGGNAVSITYTTGATAGSEVCTVSGNAVTIQIQNGTSTATQVKAKFDATGAATALGSCTISGTGSNAQKTVNASAMTGAAATSVGDELFKSLSVTATGALVRGSAAKLKAYYIYNNSASATRYVRFYDKVTAPTVGTDVPKFTIAVPPMSAANLSFPRGSEPMFYAGLGIGATGAVADNDSTAVTANDVVMNLEVGGI